MPSIKRSAVIVPLAVMLAGSAIYASQSVMAKKTKITFMAWVTAKADSDAFNRVCKEFMKDHKDIEVKFIGENWTGDLGYFQKYLAMTTAGVAPDIVMVPHSWIPNFAEAKILEDLTPWMKRSKMKTSEWSEAGIESSSWKGKMWGLNGGTSSDWWIQFNRKVIAESGMVDPGKLAQSGNWNWDTMEAIMLKTSRFDGQKNIRIGLDQMGDLCSVAPWIWGMGGQVLNADGTKCLLGEQGAIDAISRVHNLIFGKKIMGIAWVHYGLDHINSAKKNQFAMTAWWNTFATFLTSQKIPWQVDMVPFPPGPKGAKTVVTQIHNMCMSKQSKEKNAAWEFLRFIGGSRGQTMLLEDLQGLPTRKDVIKKLAETYSREKMPSAAATVDDAMRRQRSWDRSTKMHLALPKLNDYLSKIWTGKADVATTLKDAAKAADKELSRAGKK